MPIYTCMLKTFRNFLLQNKESYFLEAWHEALMTGAGVLTMAYFTAGQIFAYAFEWGKLL